MQTEYVFYYLFLYKNYFIVKTSHIMTIKITYILLIDFYLLVQVQKSTISINAQDEEVRWCKHLL